MASEIAYTKLGKAIQYVGYMNEKITESDGLMNENTLSLDGDPWGTRKEDLKKIQKECDKKDNWKTESKFRNAATAIKNGNHITDS